MNATKKRSDNWTAEDKMLLQELVRERVGIIENKNTDTNTNRRKVAAWADLLNSFNIMRNGSERTATQLKNQWGTLKSAEKRKVSAEKKDRLKTGGGPPPREDPTDFSAIQAWLPQEFETDTNEFDSDSINQIRIVGKSAATATAISEKVFEVQVLETLPVVHEITQPAVEVSPAPQAPPTREVRAPQRVVSTGQSGLRTKKRKVDLSAFWTVCSRHCSQ
ncbi:hypothetical protein MSG28_000685 [Choristoneura fumiferana]|uniref:Uncharacterized protein n=1 Tax=Choristoneura fumiferana TaxID=7141 RepID=A0ACC0K1T5_CHOFU|nr:hypothetical protein MSG28_000685 [Choristoneura fumiferana]